MLLYGPYYLLILSLALSQAETGAKIQCLPDDLWTAFAIVYKVQDLYSVFEESRQCILLRQRWYL
jgi:hypothetical protein